MSDRLSSRAAELAAALRRRADALRLQRLVAPAIAIGICALLLVVLQRLSQTVSTTVNIGSDLINQARNGFRETKDILDRVREFLPATGVTAQQMAAMDRLEQRIDAESWTDLFAGILTMHGLIEEAKRRALVGPDETAAAEEEATAEAADSIISDYLG